MKPIVISQLACMVRCALDGFSHGINIFNGY